MISCTEKQAQKQKPEQPEEPTEKPINYTEAMTDMKMEYSDYINYRQYLVNANKKMTETIGLCHFLPMACRIKSSVFFYEL